MVWGVREVIPRAIAEPVFITCPQGTRFHSSLRAADGDASERGVGAVLTQADDHGDEHPVAYFSRKLLPREEKFSTIEEKECLAIKCACQTFRVYILCREFTIQTDHRALEWLNKRKENNARLTRWSLALQPLHFDTVPEWQTRMQMPSLGPVCWCDRVVLSLVKEGGV